MSILIGISGRAQSGKDTAAQTLVEEMNFHRYAFADPLKEAAQSMFGLTDRQTWDDDLKDEVNEFWGITHREMFQRLGTEGARDVFRSDIWIKRAEKELKDFRERNKDFRIVISDVRFDNEADWIMSEGGFLLHIKRDGVSIGSSEHASENGLNLERSDLSVFELNNNGTIEDFEDAVLDFAESLIYMQNKMTG